MGHAVFIHRADSIYEDNPAQRYHILLRSAFGYGRAAFRPVTAVEKAKIMLAVGSRALTLNLTKVVRRTALLVIALSTCLGGSVIAANLSESAREAREYLSLYPQDQKLYVYPNRLHLFELLGDDKGTGAAVIQAYNRARDGYSMVYYPAFPLVSINMYDGDTVGAERRFLSQSNMVSAYKQGIVKRSVWEDPCTFTRNTTRDTWPAHASAFIDTSRIAGTDLEGCLSVALDYINGFPMRPDMGYRDAPADDVRRLIMSAIIDCSRKGNSLAEDKERSRDGFTALPAMECVIASLENQ